MVFTFSIGSPPLPSLSDCVVLLHKTKRKTLKKDSYKGGGEKNTREHRLRRSVFTAWLKDTIKGRGGDR